MSRTRGLLLGLGGLLGVWSALAARLRFGEVPAHLTVIFDGT